MAASMRSVICRRCSRKSRCFLANGPSCRSLKLLSTKSATKWKGVIGLEIHAQIQAESKLFSGSASRFGAPVNSQVALLDSAFPGTLPVLNRRCVEAGVTTALALECDINKVSKFDRKHYFYADLPAGYQITQQRQPLGRGGRVRYAVLSRDRKNSLEERSAKLVQLQLEQDSGKSLHDDVNKVSLIDLNRAGCALMEIVTEPDFSNSEEATSFVKELRRILQAVGTCDGKMDEGSLRVDANISVHKKGEPLGVRSEVKNLNSIRSLRKAIDHEIERQIKVLEGGGVVVNETRAFDIDIGETVPMRDKEVLQDYRFMPEPNLPPLHVYNSDTLPASVDPGTVVLVDRLREELPPLPQEVRKDIQEKYKLSALEAAMLVNEDGFYELYEEIVEGRDPRHLFLFLSNDFLCCLNDRNLDFSDNPLSPSAVAEIYDMFKSGDVSFDVAKKLMKYLLERPGETPRQVVEEKDWGMIQDEDTMRQVCQQLIDAEPKALAQFRAGKKKVYNFFYGRATEQLERRADPKILRRVLNEMLSK